VIFITLQPKFLQKMKISSISRILYAFAFILSLFVFRASEAQILKPVEWSFEKETVSGDVVELRFIADIDPGWHVYATDIPEGGPIPTSFNYNDSDQFELAGPINTPEAMEKFDNAFEMMLKSFDGQAIFSQRVKLLTEEPFVIKGELEFMACDDSRCLPPEYVEFSFAMNGAGPGAPGEAAETGEEETSGLATIGQADETIPEPAARTTGEEEDGGSLLAFFLIALGVGFVGLLTPCVYPMIPMTVSFFMNAGQSKAKGRMQALVFGFSIIFIYTFIGVLVSVLFGADAIKSVSDHWLTNLIFFLLFATFAASFFGMFEIVLPSWLTNKRCGA
jgi:thiol:disulfide interchange protein DsbD